MRIALAQMQMQDDIAVNLDASIKMMQKAKDQQADLILFPEIQLSPFFPKYEKQDVKRYVLSLTSKEITALCLACKQASLWASPNVYLTIQDKNYDASLFIDDKGEILGLSKMMHIAQAPCFYEQDYYAPSDDGFKVYDSPWGKIGIVICFDRHIPTSIRSCAKQGADLILIPTANMVNEPLALFAAEIQVQAYQNTVFIAMCNRVGMEDDCTFAGESLVASPDGSLLFKADDQEGCFIIDLPLDMLLEERQKRAWLQF